MRYILSLVKLNFRLEWRAKETISLLVGLALILSILVAFGISGAYLTPQTRLSLFPTFLWLIFVFSATVSVGRNFDYDLKNRAIDGVLLSGAPAWAIFLSKAFSNFCLLCIAHTVNTISLAVFMNVDVNSFAPELVLISLPTLLAYSSLSTLLSGISATSRLKHIMLPLILIPLLFPLFYSALELTAEVIAGASVLQDPTWIAILLLLDLIYLLFGASLFESVIKE